ncbi:MAG: hypothetical protein ACRDJW_04585 [Thermomicrobiales bacterium]
MANPHDIFVNYDGDPVPEEEWSTFLPYVLPQALQHWSRSTVLEAAKGSLIPIAINLPTSTQMARIERVLRTLRRNPIVELARQQLTALVSRQTERQGTDATLNPMFREMIWTQIDRLADDHRVPGVSRRDLVMYLFATAVFPGLTSGPESDTVYRSSVWSMVFVESRPVVWANLSRRPLNLKLDPGQIVVDITHSSDADLQELWDEIRQTQRRLSTVTPRGGRPSNDQRAERIEQLLKQGARWGDIPAIVFEEFPPRNPAKPPTLDSLKRMQTAWRARKRGTTRTPR